MEYCFYLDFTGWKPEVWAAWIQAIGSVAAIAAAYWLARRSENQAKRQREAEAALKAKSMALALVTPVQSYGNQIRPAFEEVVNCGIDSYPSLVQTISLPRILFDSVLSLHELGVAAEPFLAFIRSQQLMQRAIHEVLEADHFGIDGPQFEALELSVRKRFDSLYISVAEALDALNRAADGKEK